MENRDPSSPNPYAAPVARVDDPSAAAHPGDFSPDGERVPAGHGMRWIVEGFGIYKTQPMLWIGISFAFLVITFAVQLVPVLGWLAGGVVGPVWIAGIMIGCQAIMTGERMRFAHLFAGFSQNAGRLMLFGLVNIVIMIVVSVVGVALSYSILGRGFTPGTIPSAGGIVLVATVFLVLATPYLMLVWYGPPLIALSNQEIGPALRGSFIACAKNWLPFTVYGLVLLVFALAVMIVVGALGGFAMFGFVQGSAVNGNMMAGMAGMGMGLALMLVLSSLILPLFFASLYASFRDIFYRP